MASTIDSHIICVFSTRQRSVAVLDRSPNQAKCHLELSRIHQETRYIQPFSPYENQGFSTCADICNGIWFRFFAHNHCPQCVNHFAEIRYDRKMIERSLMWRCDTLSYRALVRVHHTHDSSSTLDFLLYISSGRCTHWYAWNISQHYDLIYQSNAGARSSGRWWIKVYSNHGLFYSLGPSMKSGSENDSAFICSLSAGTKNVAAHSSLSSELN